MQKVYVAKKHSTDHECNDWVMGVFDSIEKAKESIELWFTNFILPHYPKAKDTVFQWSGVDVREHYVMHVSTKDYELKRDEREYYYTVDEFTINAPVPR